MLATSRANHDPEVHGLPGGLLRVLRVEERWADLRHEFEFVGDHREPDRLAFEPRDQFRHPLVVEQRVEISAGIQMVEEREFLERLERFEVQIPQVAPRFVGGTGFDRHDCARSGTFEFE